MASITLTLFTLGCSSRRDIVLRRSDDNTTALIRYDGHLYSADWRQFALDNFTCPLSLID